MYTNIVNNSLKFQCLITYRNQNKIITKLIIHIIIHASKLLKKKKFIYCETK